MEVCFYLFKKLYSDLFKLFNDIIKVNDLLEHNIYFVLVRLYKLNDIFFR